MASRKPYKEAFRATRRALWLESLEQVVIAIILAALVIAIVYLLGGQIEGWSQLIVTLGTAIALALAFPVVYLLKLGRLASRHGNVSSMLLIVFGSVVILLGIGAVTAGVLSYAPAEREPELALLPPKEAYVIRWDPTQSLWPNIRPKSKNLRVGHNDTVDFLLQDSDSVPKNDVTITWHTETVGLEDVVRASARLRGYVVTVGDDDVSIAREENRNRHTGDIVQTSSVNEATVTDVRETALPSKILNNILLYVVAGLPEAQGESISYTLSALVSWKRPEPHSEAFEVRAIAENAAPPGSAIALATLIFEIKAAADEATQ